MHGYVIHLMTDGATLGAANTDIDTHQKPGHHEISYHTTYQYSGFRHKKGVTFPPLPQITPLHRALVPHVAAILTQPQPPCALLFALAPLVIYTLLQLDQSNCFIE